MDEGAKWSLGTKVCTLSHPVYTVVGLNPLFPFLMSIIYISNSFTEANILPFFGDVKF